MPSATRSLPRRRRTARSRMDTLLRILIVVGAVAAWFVVTRFVLPKLGLPT